MKLKLTSIFALLAFISCSKSEDQLPANPSISSIPVISIEEMKPTEINQFGDVTFFIRYTDGDGNIGDVDADKHALEILDTRDSILYTYHVPPQSPVPGVTITGVLEVGLKNIILLDQNNLSETTVFKIRLKDALQNWSETVESPMLTIKK